MIALSEEVTCWEQWPARQTVEDGSGRRAKPEHSARSLYICRSVVDPIPIVTSRTRSGCGGTTNMRTTVAGNERTTPVTTLLWLRVVDKFNESRRDN